MKKTTINTLHRAAWEATVVLLGLLLSSGELADAGDETAFKTLPTDCLAVATTGTIPAFDATKIGCDRTTAIPSEKNDGLKSLQLDKEHFKVNLLPYTIA